MRPFFDCFEKERCPKEDALEVTAYYLGRLMKADTYVNPDEMFFVTYHLWDWLSHTSFKSTIEDMVADYLGRRWRKIIEE